MTRALTYRHEFVVAFPEPLEEGILYVSTEFGNVAHRCMCGCRQEVFSQLSPGGWVASFDGESVSLNHSIGNWSYPCQAHYWLKGGRVIWEGQWSREEIEAGRQRDRLRRAKGYGADDPEPQPSTSTAPSRRGLRGFLDWLSGR